MKKLCAMLLMGLLVVGTGRLMADNEVNGRLDNQDARVDNGRADGQLNKGQADHLHHEDHKIHKEVRRDRAAHHGHLTKAEHRHVNHQLNHVSHQIHHDKTK